MFSNSFLAFPLRLAHLILNRKFLFIVFISEDWLQVSRLSEYL